MKRRILLISPDFFSYHLIITRALENQGWDVTYLSDRPSNHTLVKILIRKFKLPLTPILSFFYKKKLRPLLNSHKYEKILIIKGEGLTPSCFRFIKKHTKKEIVLYFWDNLKNIPGGKSLSKVADVVYTFDPHDARKYNFKLLPLFYVQRHENPPSTNKWKASFVGSIHSDRLKVLAKIKLLLPKEALIYVYFPSIIHYYYRLLFDFSFKFFNQNEIKLTPLSRKDTDRIFTSSIAVLDIQYPNQYGLSMRTMEALSLGKKLITTNDSIKDYPFYSDKQILIIQRENIIIPEKFWTEPNDITVAKKIELYEINNWIKAILS